MASAGVASFSCPLGYKVAVSKDVSKDASGDVFCEGRRALSLLSAIYYCITLNFRETSIREFAI